MATGPMQHCYPAGVIPEARQLSMEFFVEERDAKAFAAG